MDRPIPSASPRFADGTSAIYTAIVVMFVGFLLISNIAATKLIAFGPIITDGGAFLFPLTYILGDVLAEVYGLKRARRAIFLGFVMAALAAITFLAVGAAPPDASYQHNDAFNAVLGFVPRIVIASLCGYFAGQFLNAYVLVKLKSRTDENGLWARLLGSTLVGELADTAIFCIIAFAWVLPASDLFTYTWQGYVYKVAVEIVFLPVTYAVIRAIKKREPSYAR